jgi:hypothetical protein
MEGFENPTMATLFQEMLKVDKTRETPQKRKLSRTPGTSAATVGSNSAECRTGTRATRTSTAAIGSGGATETSSEKVAFLKSILLEQREMADSLMKTAKKMGPVSQTVLAKKSAYDAAFETEPQAALPNSSGTLQGFAILFFLLSFFSLAILSSIITSQSAGLTGALKTFGAFFVAFLVIYGLLTRAG